VKPIVLALFVALVACAGRRPAEEPTSSEPGTTTETKTIKKKDGSTETVTITKKVVPAPEPPDRPADPWPSDPLVKYNVDGINAYRKKHGLPALKYDAKISAFAKEGSKQLAVDHTAHAHFNAKIKSQLGDPQAMKGGSGFGSRSAENQGDWNGIPQLDPDPAKNGRQQIDVTLKLMYDEGPGGGHYENMVNPKLKRVGVGIHWVGPKMYLTNDFSD
jgi:hypothetical protein